MVKPIPNADYGILSEVLSWIIKCYHCLLIGRMEERIHLIAPALWSVVQLLPDMEVSVEQDLVGSRVHTRSHFEFILTRGSKRVCIMQVRKERFG